MAAVGCQQRRLGHLPGVLEASYLYLESVQNRGNDGKCACIPIGLQIALSTETWNLLR
jgi:hypothetical protein